MWPVQHLEYDADLCGQYSTWSMLLICVASAAFGASGLAPDARGWGGGGGGGGGHQRGQMWSFSIVNNRRPRLRVDRSGFEWMGRRGGSGSLAPINN